MCMHLNSTCAGIKFKDGIGKQKKTRSKRPANSENVAGVTDLGLMDRGERKEVSFGDVSHLKNQV